jgi:chemotaxis protein histidine kinase CheA
MLIIAGFSTADKITEISGRGVGMDALSQNLSDQGGNISIASNGRGSDGYMPIKFRITLPHQCLL